jgi:hypothetical protein
VTRPDWANSQFPYNCQSPRAVVKRTRCGHTGTVIIQSTTPRAPDDSLKGATGLAALTVAVRKRAFILNSHKRRTAR